MLNRTNVVLAVLLVLVLAATALLGVDYSQPNVEILPDMKYSPAWSAFAENPNFSNGRTLQAPVRGTIARGELPMYYAATKEDAVRAGDELRNPFDRGAQEADTPAARNPLRDADDALTDKPAKPPLQGNGRAAAVDENAQEQSDAHQRWQASVARGGEVYRVFCISCHGVSGAGNGPVTQRGFPPPPSLVTGKSRQMKDGQLFHILTYGQGSMASMSAQLTRPRRWDVINFVRDLQEQAPSPAVKPEKAEEPPATDSSSADPATKSTPQNEEER